MNHVYALRIEGLPDDDLFAALLMQVGDDKRDKIARFARKEDAVRALYADLLARYVISLRTGADKGSISFDYNEFGKPVCRGVANFHFNISHSGDWIVCAAGEQPVGIDIERVAPIDMDVAENYFSKQECARLFSLSGAEQLSLFYELWACKESYLKLHGMGLSKALDSFSVVPDEGGGVGIEQASGEREAAYLRQYDIDAGYKMAVCGLGDGFGEVVFLLMSEVSET